MKEAEAKAAAASLTALAVASRDESDLVAAADYETQATVARMTAAAWGEDGVYRVALHAGVQGAIGAMAGGSAGALGGAAGVVGGNLGKHVGEFLAKAQATGLSEKETQELVNTYKQTMATIGGAIAGVAAGSPSDGAQAFANAVQSGATATNVDKYNRQLHEKETAWIKDNAAAFAAKVGDISVEEATKRLAMQAAKDTDITWRGTMTKEVDPAAEAFLKEAGGLTFENSDGKQQAMFTATWSQFYSQHDGQSETDRAFYKTYVAPYAKHDPVKGVIEETGYLLKASAKAVGEDPLGVLEGSFDGMVAAAKHLVKDPEAVAEGAWNDFESSAKKFGQGVAASNEASVQNAPKDLYGQDVSRAGQYTTGAQGLEALGTIAEATGAGKVVTSLIESTFVAGVKFATRNGSCGTGPSRGVGEQATDTDAAGGGSSSVELAGGLQNINSVGFGLDVKRYAYNPEGSVILQTMRT